MRIISGGIPGTITTDTLIGMTHQLYPATNKQQTFVRVLLVDYSKAFDHINHLILLDKLENSGVPRHIVRWMAAFLVNRTQKVKIGTWHIFAME